MGRYMPWDAYPSASLAELECGSDARLDTVEASPEAPCPIAAEHHVLPNSSLWFCAQGMPETLKAADRNHVRVQFHRAGVGASWVDGKLIPVTQNQACISSARVEADFVQDFEQVVWRIPRQVLLQKLASQSGEPLHSDIRFEPVLDLSRPQAALMVRLLDCLVAAVRLEGGAQPLVAELEQALLTAFLAAGNPGGEAPREPKPLGAAPWQVRRVETYIEENWRDPITIEDLTVVTGASARSIFRAFQQSRDYTPLEFAKRLKLLNARRMFEAADESVSVTSVALECGFADLGRFSKDFVQAFGERPSVVLNRRKAVA